MVNERFVKSFNRELFVELLDGVAYAITVEDHVLQGGFGSAFLEMMAEQGINGVQVKCPRNPRWFCPPWDSDGIGQVVCI